MPDLSNKSSHEFWHKYPEPSIYKILSFMEGVENWTLDGDPELEKIINELGTTLDNIGNIDLQEEDDFIKISSYIKMGRALRLLQSMDAAHPGAASKILTHAEASAKNTENTSELFLRRNIVFERLRLLGRIFSENRLTTILQILGDK
ncbi:MAG: type IVB secretion system protein IcmW [Gammaproteobacteria bacterium]|nr:type IVB secretion system protein IcmW [Gammaproteobacteria bacterium]